MRVRGISEWKGCWLAWAKHMRGPERTPVLGAAGGSVARGRARGREGGLGAGDFGLRSLACGKRPESCGPGGANADFCFRKMPFASLWRINCKGASKGGRGKTSRETFAIV